MNFQKMLQGMKGKAVTVYLISGGPEYAGTLFDVGSDWIDVDNGPGSARSLIPLVAIACVLHR